MNQSLLSSHVYKAVSEVKPHHLWVSSDASGKTPASLVEISMSYSGELKFILHLLLCNN